MNLIHGVSKTRAPLNIVLIIFESIFFSFIISHALAPKSLALHAATILVAQFLTLRAVPASR